MKIKYDFPDMPIGTPMSFGSILILNGKVVDVTPEQETSFKQVTGMTLQMAAKSTPQLRIIREKVN